MAHLKKDHLRGEICPVRSRLGGTIRIIYIFITFFPVWEKNCKILMQKIEPLISVTKGSF